MNDSEETEEIKTFPPLPLPAARPCPTASQYQLDAPVMHGRQNGWMDGWIFCL